MEKDQTVLTPFECSRNIHSYKRCFKFLLMSDVGDFAANFDPLHSSKHNENECIL